jgi:TIGR03009 family protein
MHYRWLSLTALLCATPLVLFAAQVPAPAPAPLDPANNKLDAILVQWEKAMSSIATLYTQVERKTVDKTFRTEQVYRGEAKYLKPNKASIWLQNVAKREDFERMVCNAQFVYKWDPSAKEIQIYELEKPKQGQVSDDNFVSFMFGMKAAQAKARYTMNFDKEDQYYYYVDVFPKTAVDKSDFTRARLVLIKTTGLPRQVWFEAPNQNETTWDFNKMMSNVQIDPREFDQPTPPQGWQLKRAPQQNGPRVALPQQN